MKVNQMLVVLLLSVVSVSLNAEVKSANKLSPENGPVKLLAADKSSININKADAITLTNAVKGIGEARAKAIVKYRETHGEYKSIESLGDVPGLGKRFVKTHINQLKETFTV